MRIVIISLVTFLSTCVITRSQHAQMQLRSEIGASASRKERVESTNSQLRLDTEIIKQTYCDGPDPDLLTLRLLLRLSFTNVGNGTIILQRGSKPVPAIKISKTARDAIAHHFETTINNYIITENNRTQRVPKRPTLSGFVVLQPGQTYKTIADVNVLVPRADPVSSIIGPGSHYLQIGIWTWDESQTKAKLTRKKWRRDGVLWSETILSKPMAFTVVAKPKSEDCHCANSSVSEEQALDTATKQLFALKRSASSYHRVAFEQGCEWHVVFEAKDKNANSPNLIFIVDKNTGKVLEELQ